MLKQAVVCLFLFLFGTLAHGQFKKDIDIIKNDTSAYTELNFKNHPYSKPVKRGNIFSLAVGNALYVYQHIISDQFQPQCIFTPSCSTFGKYCTQKTNLINAILITTDRTMRCGNMNAEYYDEEPVVGGLIYDPVENYLHPE